MRARPVGVAHLADIDAALAVDCQAVRRQELARFLAGAVFGDHCSPISDTTILSSTGAACHHIDHVITQLPYAGLGALAVWILAAAIWVGGQLVLGGLIPAVRPAGPERVRAVARAFQRIAWPAFALAIAWTFVASVVAVRQALDYTSTWRAIAVCALGLSLSFVVALVLGLVFGPTVSGA